MRIPYLFTGQKNTEKVRHQGFEPWTPGLRVRCSSHLS